MSETVEGWLMRQSLEQRGATVRTAHEVTEIAARIKSVYRTIYTVLMFTLIVPIGIISLSSRRGLWVSGVLCLLAGAVLAISRPTRRAQAPPYELVYASAYREHALFLKGYFPGHVQAQLEQLEKFAGSAFIGVYGNWIDHYLVIRPKEDEWMAVYQWGLLRVFTTRTWPWTPMHDPPRATGEPSTATPHDREPDH